MIERQPDSRAEGGGPDPVPLRRKRPLSLRRLTVPAVILTLLPVAIFGMMYVRQQIASVYTDNAQVTGTLAQLGPINASRLRTIEVDVGDPVVRNQPVATLSTATGQLVSLRAPFDGVVMARYANPGDALTAGKAVLAVLNPEEMWIEARVEEWQAGRLRPGQEAEVTIDALGRTVPGVVSQVGDAAVASVSAQAAPLSAAAGRPRQLVPVRVVIDRERLDLVYGGLASVRIHTQ